MLLLLRVDGLALALVFAVFWGLATRGERALGQMMVAQLYGRSSYGTILGTISPVLLVALGLGPTLGAVARDTLGRYEPFLALFAPLYLIAALLMYFARTPSQPPSPVSPRDQVPPDRQQRPAL